MRPPLPQLHPVPDMRGAVVKTPELDWVAVHDDSGMLVSTVPAGSDALRAVPDGWTVSPVPYRIGTL